MLRRAAQRLIGAHVLPCRAYSQELIKSDRKLWKKFIGVEDNLEPEKDARGRCLHLLSQLVTAAGALPETSDYRRALEATCKYRLKVLEHNDSDAAVEEVLDAHLEEIILECKEELGLVSLMQGARRTHSHRNPPPHPVVPRPVHGMTRCPAAPPVRPSRGIAHPGPSIRTARPSGQRARCIVTFAASPPFFDAAASRCAAAEWKPYDVPADHEVRRCGRQPCLHARMTAVRSVDQLPLLLALL